MVEEVDIVVFASSKEDTWIELWRVCERVSYSGGTVVLLLLVIFFKKKHNLNYNMIELFLKFALTSDNVTKK